MAPDHDYRGKDVFSNDGDKLGQVKDVFDDPEMSYEYLFIKRPRAKDRVMRASLAQRSNGHLVVPFGQSFIDDAPDVDVSGGRLSYYDWKALEDFYGHRVA